MPPRLAPLNTEQTVDDPKLAQTTFWLDSREVRYVEAPGLYIDQSRHEPTPEEDSLTPFYQDSSQRILAIDVFQRKSVFVVKTEVLLELARGRGGMELEWGQWRTCVVKILSHESRCFWVSGPRLFTVHRSVRRTSDPRVHAYDFSPRAFARRVERRPTTTTTTTTTTVTRTTSTEWRG